MSAPVALLASIGAAASHPNEVLDGSAHKNIGSGSSTTMTLTTTGAGVVVIGTTSNDVGISSVTSSNTTGWARRTNQEIFLDYWVGKSAGALTSEVITVNFTGTTGFITLDMFGIKNADRSTIFDPNGALPASESGGGTPATTTITTTNANNFLLSISRGSTGSPTPSAGWTLISGADFQMVQYKIVSVTQSGLSVASSTEDRIIADAVTRA